MLWLSSWVQQNVSAGKMYSTPVENVWRLWAYLLQLNMKRKDYEHTMRVEKDLKDLDATDLNLPAGTKLYINDSLCPYYRELWNEAKKLWNKKKIFSYFTVSGTVRIRLQEKGPYSIIAHIDDLKELFPDEDFSMF